MSASASHITKGGQWNAGFEQGDDHVEVPLAVEVLAKGMSLTGTKTPADLLASIKARA